MKIPGDIAEPYGTVNTADLKALAEWWLSDNCQQLPDHCGGADLSGPANVPDGSVNGYDFRFLASHWLERIPGDIAEPYGQVDVSDLIALSQWWMVAICDSFFEHCFGADMTGPDGVRDGVVNLYDFAMLASHWMEIAE